MAGYLKLAKDMGGSAEDIEASRGALQQYRQSTKGQGAEYDSPDVMYGFLADTFENANAGKLGQVEDAYSDYNLRRLFNQDIGNGGAVITGFNPRAVGNAVLDINPEKFQRVGNMMDLAQDYGFDKSLTQEQLEDFGAIKQRKRMGDDVYQVKIGNNDYRAFEPGTEQVQATGPDGEPLYNEDGTPQMVTQDKVNTGFVGDSDNYVKTFVQKQDDGTYKILPKESEPFRKYVFKAPEQQGGFLGSLGPLAQLAALIPGPQQPFVYALNAANAADAGNWGSAILNSLGAYGGADLPGSSAVKAIPSDIGKYLGFNDPTWAANVGKGVMSGAGAAIDGRDAVTSALSAGLGPTLGMGPFGGMAITYGLNALRGRPTSGTQVAQNASTPTTVEQQLSWQLPRSSGSGLPAAPRTPTYK